MKFDRRIGNGATEAPVKFQTTVTSNLAVGGLTKSYDKMFT